MGDFDRDAWDAAARVGMGSSYHASLDPDGPAVIAPTGDRTKAELDANANRLVRLLRARGLGSGDGVAILCSNRAEFVEVYAACTRGGFRLTTVNWHLTPDEAAYIVDDSGARAFVADAACAAAVPPATNADVRLAVGGWLDGFDHYALALAPFDGAPLDDPELGTAMLYTSGTTGYPKGVLKPPDPDAIVLGTIGYGYGPDDVHLVTGPLYHAAPFQIGMVVPVTCGVPMVLMERWDAAHALELIERHRVTHLHAVPTYFHRMLALPEDVRANADTSSLKAIVHGAAPCPVHVKQAIIDWLGPIVTEYYAATEGAACIVDSATWLTKPGTVGKPMGGQAYVGDDDAQELPTGDEGLVWIKAAGRQRFEYKGDAGKTAGAYRGEYFTLGDVGRMDEDGFLFLTDRSANLIISGGVNIYPAEIDAVLLSHPAVADAGAIGVPDDEWGETVLAVVELEPGAEVTEAELLALCRSKLAAFKCPRAVAFVDRLPRDENGKLYKRRLRDQFRSGA